MKYPFPQYFVILGVLKLTQATEYCATFNPTTTNSASGYFTITLSEQTGESFYNFKLNLNQFSTSCDLRAGLTYHIHSFWYGYFIFYNNLILNFNIRS